MSTGSNFGSIGKEITMLQQRMADLKAENTELRQQLNNLRSGHNILLEIAGQRFSFASDAITASASDAISVRTLPEPPSTPPIVQQPEVPTTPMLENSQEYPTLPRMKAQQDGEKKEQKDEQEEKQKRPATFLEEIMLDEFAAAASTPLAVWTGPLKKQEPISEDQKEALRRELMGSFLLE